MGYSSGVNLSGAYLAAAALDDTAYDATSWNGDTTHAPTKNAVRDKIESLGGVTWPLANVGAAAATDAITSRVTGNTQDRFVLDSDGTLRWGGGSAAVDVAISRSAANTLDLWASRINLNVGGSAPLTIDASDGQPTLWQEANAQYITIKGYGAATKVRFMGSLAGGSVLTIAGAADKIPTVLQAAAAQTADLHQWRSSADAVLFSIDATGHLTWVAGKEQTTVGAAGGASALPATPTKYLKVKDSAGTTLVIPAYAAA